MRQILPEQPGHTGAQGSVQQQSETPACLLLSIQAPVVNFLFSGIWHVALELDRLVCCSLGHCSLLVRCQPAELLRQALWGQLPKTRGAQQYVIVEIRRYGSRKALGSSPMLFCLMPLLILNGGAGPCCDGQQSWLLCNGSMGMRVGVQHSDFADRCQ